MRKLKLDLDALNVETFDTTPPDEDEGTVLANQVGITPTPVASCIAGCITLGQTCVTCFSCRPTCFRTCFTCGGTCIVTCQQTCITCLRTCGPTCVTCRPTCFISCGPTCLTCDHSCRPTCEIFC
jgi:hypothetical protein